MGIVKYPLSILEILYYFISPEFNLTFLRQKL